MPIEVENQPGLGMRAGQAISPADPVAGGDVFGAAFRQTNTIVSAIQYARNQGHFAPEDGYNPVDDIKAWKDPRYLLDHGTAFVGSRSRGETQAIKDQIDRETEDKKLLAANGGTGFLAQMMAGMLDPTILLPGGVAVDASRGGLAFTRAAANVGKAALLQTTAQEALLQATQQTRTMEESAINVASGTLLTALIGGGAAALLSRGERAAIEVAVHADRAEMNAHAGNPGTGETPMITAYHGSPFDFDRFDSRFIDSGEGRQSEGRGFYFATSPDVADWYAKRTSGLRLGLQFNALTPEENAAFPRKFDTRFFNDSMNADTVRDILANTREQFEAELARDPGNPKWAEGLKAIDKIEASGNFGVTEPKGTVYQVRLKAREGDLVDLRKPLSEQPEKVRAILEDIGLKDGGDFEVTLMENPDTARKLQDAGVAGIKYGHETDNIVIFDPANIEITHKNGRPVDGPPAPASSGAAASAGAAASDTRKLELVSSGIDKIPVIGKVMEKTSPMQRLFNALSPTARRTTADLAETSLLFKENLEGGTTTLNGPALDREARLHINQTQVAVGDEMSRLFSEYRFGEEVRAPRMRAGFEDFTGRREAGKLSFDEFKEQVSDALRNGDQHEIPQVAAAAQVIRQKVFEPWKKRAIDAGLFGEDVDVKTAESYLQRVYNKQAIAAKRPEFVERVTDWLLGDQATKAAAQEKIGFYHAAMQSHQATIDKLQGQIERRQLALDDIEARQEEVRRFNAFAYKRSESLSEPIDALRSNIARIEAQIQPHLQRLEKLREDISAQKDLFPDIRFADSLIFKMIGAAQKLKQSKGLIEAVDAASEYADAIEGVIGGFKGGIREASQQAKLARRELGATELMDLEKSQAKLRKEVAPFLKKLRELRKELKEERETKLPGARGGAVFETEIRGRGNVLADRASGKDAEIAALEERLGRETVNHDQMRAKLEEQIAAWEGKSVAEAKAALKARAEAEKARQAKIDAGAEIEAKRLRSADAAVDKAVRRILDPENSRDLSRDELRSRAQQITDRILGSPDGRLPYDVAQGGPEVGVTGGEPPRGPLASREFNIPDAMIKDYLENDVEHIVGAHLRTIVPDVLLTERFGDTRMTEAFRKINDEYAALVDAATSEKERTRLEKERQGVIRDLAAVRDRIRGVYGLSSDAPLRNAARVAGALKNYNVLTSMGAAALSSLPDMAGTVMRHGMTNVFRDAYVPFFQFLTKQSDAWSEAARQYRAMGIAVESVLASRHHALTDTLDTYHPQSRVERTLQWATNRFQFVNLLAPWTDWAKVTASMTVGSEILRAAEQSVKGTATARTMRLLGESGIDPQMARRIHEAFQTGGEVRDGVHLPNTGEWTDASARLAFEAAVARDADIAVITPGQEKPLWMSHPLLSVLGQFKSFTAAATERTLISNLQRRDAQVLQGLMFSLGLGMLSYKLNSVTGGQPVSDKPQDWVKEAISRGGLLGWFEEANALASKASGGSVDIYRAIGANKPLSRYASRTASDQLLGPTKGKIDSIIGLARAASHPSDWNEADSKALRRLIAGQNVFYVRRLFDQVEANGNAAFGIPMKQKVENR